jgi:hypothetical protein
MGQGNQKECTVSRLDALAARDLGHLVEDGSDLGTDATFQAAESTDVLAIRLVFGDPIDGISTIPEGSVDGQTMPATTRLSVIKDAIKRAPQIGDTVRIESGAMAGEWAVAGVLADQGDGCNLALRWDRPYSVGRTPKA